MSATLRIPLRDMTDLSHPGRFGAAQAPDPLSDRLPAGPAGHAAGSPAESLPATSDPAAAAPDATGGPATPPRLDDDPGETAEWVEALDAVVAAAGPGRARFLLDALQRHADRNGLAWHPNLASPFVNTIPVSAQPRFPGDLEIERELAAIMR